MTQEDKQLLLKDLCARLPYGVKCQITDTNDESFVRSGKLLEIKDIGADAKGITFLFFNEHVPCYSDITEIKPYLRPISSMTEEDNLSLSKYVECSIRVKYGEIYFPIIEDNTPDKWEKVFDWLNRNHFDYRGLIPKGLALEALKGMYEKKTSQD